MVWQRAHWRHPDTPDPSLQTLVEIFHDWQCSDVRDKVYALVGMVSQSTAVVLDYSCTAKELYFAVQKQDIKYEPKFYNLLSQILGLPGKDLRLPNQEL